MSELAKAAERDELAEAKKIIDGMDGPIIRTMKGKRFISEREHCAAMLLARAYLAQQSTAERERRMKALCEKAIDDAESHLDTKAVHLARSILSILEE